MTRLTAVLMLALALSGAPGATTAIAQETPAAGPPAAPDATLTIHFEGIRTRKGVVIAALFDNRADYDADTRPLRLFRIPAAQGDFSITIAGLRPGRYGLKAFHDKDGDGTITLGPVGLPTEPYAFSNNVRGFGPAPWRAAAFTLTPGPNRQRLRLF